MKTIGKTLITNLFKQREADSHKGSYGHALLIAGNKGKMGAAVIAAKSCLRSGVGLITVNVPETERSILQTTIPEAMVQMRSNKKFDFSIFNAIAIGPGIGVDKNSKRLLEYILNTKNCPLVLDADALNIISLNKKMFNDIPKGSIITPHPKEFDRLFGPHDLVEDRIKTAVKVAKEFAITVVLKGHKTLVTDNGEAFVNTTGNAGLAKGGSGDALTGLIVAFLAQGYDSFNAAKIAVYLHGLAADLVLENQSMESMLISDVIDCLGKAFKSIS